ncbi:MAG TPA: hypothetical protein VK853_08465 [Ilumatobacteraceae bacterium]|nr:hypothetical protein [Ilumatobacteraceae bacterium]
MVVTAKFISATAGALPNVATALTLRLHNHDDDAREVALDASGDLSGHTRLSRSSAILEANQIVDVPVTVVVPPTIAAGSYTLTAEVTVRGDASRPEPEGPPSDGADIVPAHPDVVTATATMEVASHTDFAIALQPAHSKGSSSGRHLVKAVNTGNVPILVDLAVDQIDDGVTVELGHAALTIAPGATHETSLEVTPATTYRSGPTRDYGFVVRATTAEGRCDELVGSFQQRPRVPNWLGPAAAGAFAALLVGMIAWFAVLRPWVEDTADQAAAEAIEQDRAALRERIEELEAAAAEARELPLGAPADIRLDVDPAGGNVEAASANVEPGTVWSITDVVFQNPSGAVGTVSLRRGDEVILRSELANFRDFDLHFVAPYTFAEDTEIVLEVDCRTPGAGASTCPVGVSLVGFVDRTD